MSASISNASLLPEWFYSEQGHALIEQECIALKTLVPDQFYRVALQLDLKQRTVMRDLSVEQAVYCDADSEIGGEVEGVTGDRVIALPEALPFAEASVDLGILFHTLDYCDDPHRALREISQVLTHQGVLVVTGFHPYSLWAIWRRLKPKQPPYNGRFISRSVLQDWLELLGFQTVTGCMLNYQPPQLSSRWRDRLKWMNKAGDRWWPTLGAVYVIVVKKQLYGGIPMGRTAKQRRKWFPEVNPASARDSLIQRDKV